MIDFTDILFDINIDMRAIIAIHNLFLIHIVAGTLFVYTPSEHLTIYSVSLKFALIEWPIVMIYPVGPENRPQACTWMCSRTTSWCKS